MAVKVMTLVYETRFGSPAAKAVALKLADCANDDGSGIWPAKETIAEETEVSKRTVDRHMNVWLVLGLLKIQELGGGPLSRKEARVRGCRYDAGKTTIYALDIGLLQRLHAGETTIADMIEEGRKAGVLDDKGDAKPQAVKAVRDVAKAIEDLSKGAISAPLAKNGKATSEGATAAPSDEVQGCNRVTLRVQPCHAEGATTAPEPSINHPRTISHTEVESVVRGCEGAEPDPPKPRKCDHVPWHVRQKYPDACERFIDPVWQRLMRPVKVENIHAVLTDMARMLSKHPPDVLDEAAEMAIAERQRFPLIQPALATAGEAAKRLGKERQARERRARIAEEKAERERSEKAVSNAWVHKSGSPQYEAWVAHYREHDREGLEIVEQYGRDSWRFASEWPPGHPQAVETGE